MKKHIFISFLIIKSTIWAQSALYNGGTFQLHENANVGFHTDLINDGVFNQNTGLVGFYNEGVLFFQGTQSISLFDTEFAAQGNLFLENTINIGNNANFIFGNVNASQENVNSTLNFEVNSFFTGEANDSKVIGFTSVNEVTTFSFPIGDEEQLRSLVLNSTSVSEFANAAYFFESPNGPNSYNQTFDIDTKIRDIGFITNNEFWVLNNDTASNITVSWNIRSDLAQIATVVEDIILVGWSKVSNQWTSLGNTAFAGDLNEGFITSDTFNPAEYAAITFGTRPLPLDTFATNNPTLGNYFISPNEDGTNDFLIFDNLEDTGPNQLFIFNSLGQKVFQMNNYTNEFNGVSNIDNFVINRELGLEEGIYYYALSLFDLNLSYQGFLFLDR